jgi:serine/threonine-protein kinase
MAQVFVGDHIDASMGGRQVAIKVLLAEHCRNQQITQRFINEARALGRINHPGVVDVFDVDRTADGRICLVMELLQGDPLEDWLKQRGALPVAEALPLMIQTADTLSAAHAQRIIHRDIKPDNIFVVRDQLGLRIKVLDFGIAKLLEGAGGVQTATASTMGTAAYMPPEQFRSSKYVDHRSDIYSLGCVFFQMLAGRPPFLGRTLVEHMKAHAFEQPPVLSNLVAGVPPPLEQLVNQMLAKEPDKRPQSMQEVVAALQMMGRPSGAHAAVSAAMPSVSAPMPAVSAPMAAVTAPPTETVAAAPARNNAVLIAVLAVVLVIGAAVAVILATG